MNRVRKIHVLLSENVFAGREIIKGIERYAQRLGTWDIYPCSNRLTGTAGFLRNLTGDGVIVHLQSPLLARSLRRLKRPVVNLFDELPQGRCPYPSVVVEEGTVGRLGADHFLERGYKRFAFFGIDAKWSHRREAAFAARLQEKGFDYLTTAPQGAPAVRPGLQEADQQAFMCRWLRRLKPWTGVMVCNSGCAKHLIDACCSMKRNVPEEIAVLGVDNEDWVCNFSRVPISAVDINLEEVGYEAAKMLHVLMEKKKPDSNVVVIPPKEILTRRSTNALAFEDQNFAAALRYLRDHAREGIKVRQVLAAAPISRRMLELRFHELLGHSPGEEIRRLRVEHARQLLADTNLSLLDIALRCGFQFPGHLSRAFRKTFGQTPRDYRHTQRKRSVSS